MSYERGRDRDRRKGPDLLIKLTEWFAVLGIFMLLAALYVIGLAKPETETFFDRYFDIRLRSYWDLDLARYIFYFMVFALLSSGAGLFINSRRHRRKEDRYDIFLLIVGLVSLAGIFVYLSRF